MKIIYLTILVIFLFSCSNEEGFKYQDEFYNLNNREFKHIPLIKPYEIATLNNEPWCFIFDHIYVECINYVEDISMLDVQKNIIYFSSYKGIKSCDSDSNNKYYYFIFLNNGKGPIEAFSNETDFNLFIQNKKIPRPNWKMVDDVWVNYSNTGLLPWNHCQNLLKNR